METRNKDSKQKIVTNILYISPALSIITFNINGVNTSIKRQRLSEQIKKQDPTICEAKTDKTAGENR